MLQPHFISCRGVSGTGGNMRGSIVFCQFYLVISLFYTLQRGPTVLLLWKLYLYFTRDPEKSIIFQGGGGTSNFYQGGPNVIFYRNPSTYLLFSRGCPDPLSPSGSAHGQWHHNGTTFITVPFLTIIVRHWFVRINDRGGFPNDALVLRTFDTFEKHSSWNW